MKCRIKISEVLARPGIIKLFFLLTIIILLHKSLRYNIIYVILIKKVLIFITYLN